MVSDTRGDARHLNDVFARMAREGYLFDFFQAVRLLEQRYPGGIRFRPDASLAFPPTDIRGIEFDDDTPGRVRLTLTFMGLYGVDAPLPDFIPEKVLADGNSGSPLRDFLDIFSHRLYSFFYQAWKRMRPEVGVEDRDERRFLATAGLAGTSADAAIASVARSMLSLSGLMAPRARGASGLRALLSAMLDLPVRIEENVPRWVQLGRGTGLGRGMQLAGSTMLGERILDISGKFRIWLGPMNLARYRSLLPGSNGAEQLRWIVGAYVPGRMDFDVALQLHAEELPRARLADRSCSLGLTACLGTPAASLITRIVGAEAPTRHSEPNRPLLAA